MNKFMRCAILVTLGSLAGCAGSLDRVKAISDAAPEWYEDRKSEIRGEGYPKIAEVPVLTSSDKTSTQLEASEAETLAALELFANDARSKGPEESAQEMLAWADANRRKALVAWTLAEHLTDAEIEALRATFSNERAQR